MKYLSKYARHRIWQLAQDGKLPGEIADIVKLPLDKVIIGLVGVKTKVIYPQPEKRFCDMPK